MAYVGGLLALVGVAITRRSPARTAAAGEATEEPAPA